MINKECKKVISSSFLILYASDTGTAQGVAESIWRDIKSRGILCKLSAFDDFEIEQLLQEKLVVFVVATCGNGDSPPNMIFNWRWLLVKTLPQDLLSKVNVSVIGLGDSSYEKYNFAGKRLFRRLLQLGANPLLDLALADDQHPLGVEGVMASWRIKFWLAVEDFNILESADSKLPVMHIFRLYGSRILSETELSSMSNVFVNEPFHIQDSSFNKKNPCYALIIKNKELHNKPESDRSCRHIEFLIDNTKMNNVQLNSLNYEPGDHLGIYPANDLMLVEKIAKFLNINLSMVIELVDVVDDKQTPFPCPCSIRMALTYYVDICSPTKVHVLRGLMEYTKDERQRKKLGELASTDTEEGIDEYLSFIYRPKRNIVDILEQFNTCKPPIDVLLELLSPLQPRYYSISSSPLYDRSLISITVLKLQYKIGRRSIKGVCSHFLASQEEKQKCFIFVRKSKIKLPPNINTPIIMIGSGTGLALFRSFLRERLYCKNRGDNVGEMWLFYGCRSPDQDYIYQQELNSYVEMGLLSRLEVAFSRITSTKSYVQNKIWDYRNKIWNLIENDLAYIYVCGSAKNMAKDVHNTFQKIFEEVGKLSEETTKIRLKKLEHQKRYQKDVWS